MEKADLGASGGSARGRSWCGLRVRRSESVAGEWDGTPLACPRSKTRDDGGRARYFHGGSGHNFLLNQVTRELVTRPPDFGPRLRRLFDFGPGTLDHRAGTGHVVSPR